MKIMFDRSGDGKKIYSDSHRLIGYVDNGTLFAIGKDGFADSLGPINHDSEIEPLLTKWRMAIHLN